MGKMIKCPVCEKPTDVLMMDMENRYMCKFCFMVKYDG